MTPEQKQRLEQIEARKQVSTLLPFARAADDYEPPKSKRRFRDEEHVALSLTVGHLRKARNELLRQLQELESLSIEKSKE